MTTIAEASKLWCPMARLPHLAPVYVAQPDGTPPKASSVAWAFESVAVPGAVRCISGACAMWRWSDPMPEQRDRIEWTCWDEDAPDEEPPKPPEVHPDAEWTPFDGTDDENGGYWTEPQAVADAEHAQAVAERRGYCGLAGRPEVMP